MIQALIGAALLLPAYLVANRSQSGFSGLKTKFNWGTYAGGSSSHYPSKSSYAAYTDAGDYFIDPPSRKYGAYTLRWANTQRQDTPGGLWHNVGSYSTVTEAKKAARAHSRNLHPLEFT